jgi:hypothetical protein
LDLGWCTFYAKVKTKGAETTKNEEDGENEVSQNKVKEKNEKRKLQL